MKRFTGDRTAAVPAGSPGGSRDPRIEDPSNLWVIHPIARALLPFALRRGISANAVSLTGFALGAGAAAAYYGWADWRLATFSFLLCIGWLVADGLDGMVARATNSASPLGRVLDGLCDHGVFGLLYVSIALSIGTVEAWILGWAAAAAHALQANFYEAERARYHRRIRGDPCPEHFPSLGNVLVRVYDRVEHSLDWLAEPFDRHLAATPDRQRLAALYGQRAAAPMKLVALLAANTRLVALYVAALLGNPLIFWWLELVPLSFVALAGLLWHRRLERELIEENISSIRARAADDDNPALRS